MICICSRRFYRGTPPHDSWCQCERDQTDPAALREPSEPTHIEPFLEYVQRVKRERGDFLPHGSMLTTCYAGPISRVRRFEDSTNDELRSLLRPIAPEVGRAQLLALARNRWSCGHWIETEDLFPQQTNEIQVRPPL